MMAYGALVKPMRRRLLRYVLIVDARHALVGAMRATMIGVYFRARRSMRFNDAGSRGVRIDITFECELSLSLLRFDIRRRRSLLSREEFAKPGPGDTPRGLFNMGGAMRMTCRLLSAERVVEVGARRAWSPVISK